MLFDLNYNEVLKYSSFFLNVTFYEILTILILAPKKLVFDQIQSDKFQIKAIYLGYQIQIV